MANTQQSTPATQSRNTSRDPRSAVVATRGGNKENQSARPYPTQIKDIPQQRRGVLDSSAHQTDDGPDNDDDNDEAPIGPRTRRPSAKKQAMIDVADVAEARQEAAKAAKSARVAKKARALQRAAGVLDDDDDEDGLTPRSDTTVSFRPVPSRPTAMKLSLIERSNKVPRAPQIPTTNNDRRNYREEYHRMSQHHARDGYDGRESSSTTARGRRESTPPGWQRLPSPARAPMHTTFRGADASPPPSRSPSPVLQNINGGRVPNHISLDLRRSSTTTESRSPPRRQSPAPHRPRPSSPQAGEKRRRDGLPLLDLRVVQAQRLNNGGRAKAKDFDDTTQEALGLAILIFRVFVAVRWAFPDHKQELEWVRETWRLACERMGVSIELTPALSKLITIRDSHMRGELKTKARPIVELVFDFTSGESKEAIKRNREIAELLKENNALVFQDPSARKGMFRNHAIQRIVNAVFFAHRRAPGANLPEHFDPFPLVALALILTVIENCVDEWATGIRTDIPFTASEYHEVYQRHVSTLEEFAKATKQYGILDTILQNIHDNGRAHSGAEPRVTTSQGGLLASDIAAALKEYEDEEMGPEGDNEEMYTGNEEDLDEEMYARNGDDEDELRADEEDEEDDE